MTTICIHKAPRTATTPATLTHIVIIFPEAISITDWPIFLLTFFHGPSVEEDTDENREFTFEEEFEL